VAGRPNLPSGKRLSIAKRRLRVSELLLEGMNARDIARNLRVRLDTVYNDLRAIRAEWRREQLGNTSEHLVQRLAELAADCVDIHERWKDEEDVSKYARLYELKLRNYDMRNRLLGIDSPVNNALDAGQMAQLVANLVKVITDEVVDLAIRERIADRIDELVVAFGGPPMVDVDAKVVDPKCFPRTDSNPNGSSRPHSAGN